MVKNKNEHKRWGKEVYSKAKEKNKERKKKFVDSSWKEIDPLYIPQDNADNYLESSGFPGEYPFTRGVQPTMYRGRFWTMRQYAGFGSSEETNKRFHFLLKKGQTGLSTAFDLPTQMGYDSDDPMCEGEVGKSGVAIASVHDMATLMDGIPLDKVSTSMTINASATVLLSMYMAVAEKQNVPFTQLSGTIQNDILKEYIARGTFIFPPKPSMRLIVDSFAFCAKNVPKWNPISISGYHIREAGSTAIQEVAFTLANGIAYVEAALQAGLDVDVFAPRLSFFFNAHNNVLEEAAKFRAARRLWARIMKERFKAKNPQSMMVRFHTQTGGSTLTAQQPENNVVRVTLQALSAVLGGTQSLHTNSRDEALALPTEESAKIALRTQQIIAYEGGVTETIDPLAGSYFIEEMTGRIESGAEDYIKKIDEMGGAVVAVEKGYVQKEIQESAYKYQKDIEAKEKIIVGVNEFVEEEEKKIPLLRVTKEIENKQIQRLKKVKDSRNTKEAKSAVDKLKKAAEGKENLLPFIFDAVKAEATLGEICHGLRDVWGVYRDPGRI